MKVKPRYKSKGYAYGVLREISGERTIALPDEAIAPACEWLLLIIHSWENVSMKDKDLNIKMNLLGLACTLELWPVPDWWTVRRRILGKDGDYFRWTNDTVLMFRDDTNWR